MSQANGNQAANSSPVIVPSAQANQEISVPAVVGAEVQFQFDPTTASVERVDNNLVLTLDNGGKVTITDFFVTDGQPLPMLALPDGQVVPSEAVLAGLNGDMDLSTAAGPAARPPSSGGSNYEDGAGNLIDGTDRLGSLGTDFWGNSLNQQEQGIGTIETPGGTFTFGVSSDVDGGFGVSGGLYEDGQAFQNDDDLTNDQVVAGKLNFSFTGTGTTEVESVSLTGFPVGTVIYIGDPANPTQIITIGTAGQAVGLTQAQLDGGVYLLPPPNSDADMNINASVTLVATSSGVTQTLNGSFTVVVDAVADKPTDVNVGGVDYAFGGQAGFGAATKGSVISFDVTAKFNDTDGSEDHFVLVEKQVGLTPCDASGAPVVYETVEHDGTTYYKLPVSGTTSPVTEKVYLTPDKDAVGTDNTYSLKTGALAHERAETDAELTLENNTAITINNTPVNIDVDYIDAGSESSKENAYEDNNDQQNIGGAANAAINENGEMTISLNNLGADGNNTVIQGDITISFEYPNGQTPGTFFVGNTPYTATFNNSTNTWSVSIPAAGSTSQTVRYEAPANADADLTNVKYGLTMEHKNTGETKPVENVQLGDGHLVVDAVADKPTDLGTGAVSYSLNGVGHAAAAVGSVINFTVTAKFNDTDGSEKHFVLVEKQDGLTLCDVNGTPIAYETVVEGGVTYYKLAVASDVSPVARDVYFTPDKSAVSADKTYSLKTGAMTEEQASAGELTTDNNTAVTINSGSVSIKVDYINAGSESSKENAYEDNNDQQNVGGAANAAVTENGEISISLNNLTADGNTVIKGDITITFEYPAGQTPGTFFVGSTPYTATFNSSTNTWSVAVPAANSTSQTVRYEAPANSDADLTNVKYGMTLENKTTGETKPVENVQLGDGHLVVDAVADKPTDLATGAVGYSLNGTGHTAATAGSVINFTVTAKFADTDGSEKHFVLVEKQDGLTLCDANGTPITGYETVVEGGVTYYKLAVASDVSPVTRDVYFTPDKNAVSADKTYSLKTGAMAEEQATTGELTTGNNTAVTINSGAVSIKVDYMNAGDTASEKSTFEDGDANQHGGTFIATTGNEGQITVGLTLPNGTSDTSSVINGEITITFSYKTGETPGDFFQGGNKLDLTDLGNGNWSVKVPANGTTGQTITYKAPANSDADLNNVKYSVQWENKATGEVKSVTDAQLGDGRLVVDAVADKPGIHIATNGDQVEYNKNNGTEQAAAKPGESVTLKSTVTFSDLDGSENHFVLIQQPPSGVTYEGYSLNGVAGSFNGLTVVTINGVNYYQIPVASNLPKVDVTITAKASPTADTDYTIIVGGRATETASGVDESENRNNDSYITGAVKFHVAPAEGVNAPAITNTYEDENSAQNTGGNSTNSSWGNIVFSTKDVEGDETVVDISLNFAGKLEDYGTLTYPAGVTFSSTYDPVSNTTTITLSGDMGKSATLNFTPKEDSDKDFDFKYETTTKDPESGHTFTSTGNSKVTVDAVADKPGVALDNDAGNVVEYQPQRDANGDVIKDQNGDPVEQDAARPGETVKVNIEGVTFGDYKDGSESHFITLNANLRHPTTQAIIGNTSLAKGQIITLTGEDASGKTVTQTITFGDKAEDSFIKIIGPDGAESTRPMTNAEYNAMASSADGNSNYRIPVLNEFLQLTADGKVSGSINIVAPTPTVDTTYNAKVGGYAEETSISGSELDATNNSSWTPADVKFDVKLVTSTPKIVIDTTDGKVYENDTPYANTGNETTRGSGAKINVSGIAAGETATVTLIVSGKNGANIDPADGHETEVMYVQYDADGDNIPEDYPLVKDASGNWTVTLPVTGKAAEVDGVFVLKPGYNNNSNDLKIEYKVNVRDEASGQEKNWTTEAKPGQADPNTTYDQPVREVQVDAVAQQGDIALRGDGVTGREQDSTVYKEIVPGENANIHLTVDLKGDVKDGSESHTFFVEAKDNCPVQSITIKYTGVDGNTHTVTFAESDMALQRFGSNMFNAVKLNLSPAPAGPLEVDVVIKTEGGKSDSATDTFKMGLVSQEEYNKVTAGGEAEFDLTNNKAEKWLDVQVEYSSASTPGVSGGGSMYENDTPRAHEGDETNTEKTFEVNIGTGDNTDAVTNLNISIASGSEDQGDLWLFESAAKYADYVKALADGTDPLQALNQFATNKGDSITFDDVKDMFGSNMTDNFSGKILFVPNDKSYSGEDIKIDYSVNTKDIKSGDTNSSNGSLGILVDSVAQIPTDVEVAAKEGNENLNLGDERVVHVDATFTDMDDSTQHFVLVEAKAGWSVVVDGKEYGADSLVTFETGGKTYYKIPVEPTVDSSNPKQGAVSIDVTLRAPTDDIFYHSTDDHTYEIDIRAGSIDTAKDGELTFHNNTAISKDGGTVSGELMHNHDGHVWYFEQTGAVYEDNKPNANTGDTTEQGGSFEIGYTGASYMVIDVPLDAQGNPMLELYGDKVTDLGNGQYKIDVSGGRTHFDVKFGDAYLANGGSNSDADLSFKKVEAFDSNNKPIGQITGDENLHVVVDAVADQTDVAVATKNDAGTDNTVGLTEDAVAATKGGADSEAKFTVNATFADTDGSEKHYILVEKVPAWQANAEEVYIDGKAYYRFDVTAEANAGKTSFELGLKYVGGGGGVGDGLQVEEKDGVTSYKLKVGTMSQEASYGGTGNTEFDLANNSAINLGDDVTVKYSPLDSSGAMSLSTTSFVEGDDVVIGLKLTGIALDKSDALTSFTITYDPADLGGLKLVGPNGVSIDIQSGHSSFTQAQLDGLADGTYTFQYTPDDHSHKDLTFSWSGSVRDTVSGATGNVSGSQKVQVDAKADESINEQTVVHDTEDANHTAAVAGKTVDVIVKADFQDNENGSEEHWVVLEQKDLQYGVATVQISNDGGNTWENYTGNVVTKYDQDGKAYFAVKLPDQADYEVKFTVNTPSSNADAHLTLGAGTIVVDNTRTGGADSEKSLGNNWQQNITDVTINTAVVETTKVDLVTDPSDTLKEDDVTGENAGITLSLKGIKEQDLDGDGANDEIVTSTKFTITQSGAAPGSLIGHIIYDGETYDVRAGQAVELPYGEDGFDASKGPRFVLAEGNHNSGKVTIKGTSTVVDTKSGDERTFDHTTDVTVQATADAPTDVMAAEPVYTGGNEAVAPGQPVTFTLSGTFADVDNSEYHYLLVEAKDGWQCVPNGYTVTTTTIDGVNYFQLRTNDTTRDVAMNVKMIPPAGTTDGDYALKVGGMAKDGGDVKYTLDDGNTVNVKVGAVDTAQVSGEGHGVEDGAAAITLTADGNNEAITKVVFDAPASGEIWYNGGKLTADQNGKITIDNFDTTKLAYHPAANESGDFTLTYTATVQDKASGATKAFDGSAKVTVGPVTDVPTDQNIDQGNLEQQTGHVAKVSFTLAADFADNDGSEEHFFLVKLPAGATPPAGWEDLLVSDSTLLGKASLGDTVYKIPAGADGKASFDIQVPDSYEGGDLEFKAGAVEKSQTQSDSVLSEASSSSIAPTTLINLVPDAPKELGTVNEGEVACAGQLVLHDMDGDDVSVVSVSFDGTDHDIPDMGSVTLTGAHGTLTLHFDGSYQYTLLDGEVAGNINDLESFGYTVKDSYGGTNQSSIDITLGTPADGAAPMAPSAAFAPTAEHSDDALAAQALHEGAVDTAKDQEELLTLPSGQDSLLNDCAGEQLLLGQPTLAEDGTYVHGFVYEGAEPLHIQLTDENNQVLSLRDVLFTDEETALDTYLEAMVGSNEITLIVQAGNMEHTITIEMGAGAVAGYENYNSFVEQYNMAESEEAQSAMVHQLLTSITC